jgi:hypothetical protein
MSFFPDLCVVAEFVGIMLWVTVKLDTTNGKKPNLPAGSRFLAIQLMIWPLVLMFIWTGLKLARI